MVAGCAGVASTSSRDTLHHTAGVETNTQQKPCGEITKWYVLTAGRHSACLQVQLDAAVLEPGIQRWRDMGAADEGRQQHVPEPLLCERTQAGQQIIRRRGVSLHGRARS